MLPHKFISPFLVHLDSKVLKKPLFKGLNNLLVEMRGVEPLSENIAIQLSPSADVILNFAPLPPNDGLLSRYLDKFPYQPPRIS